MADRPSEVLEWAEEELTEVRDLGTGNGLQSYANLFEPPSQMQNSGFLVRQPPYRPILNYLFNNIFRFIRHLDERYAIGDTHTTTSLEDATAISSRLGGTWVLVGTESLAGEINNVFRKTA